jgi:hypothetical protein
MRVNFCKCHQVRLPTCQILLNVLTCSKNVFSCSLYIIFTFHKILSYSIVALA